MADDNNVGITVTADDQASDPIDKLATSIDNLGTLIEDRMGQAGESSNQFFDSTTAGSVAVGEALVQIAEKAYEMVTAFTDAAQQQEQLAVSLAYMTGSSDGAKQSLTELNTFAESAPFGLQTIDDAGRRLLTVGVNAKQVGTDLKDLGNVAAAMGGNLDTNLQRLTNYFAVAQQQGEVTTTAVASRMGQLNPLLLVLQDYYGKTGEAVKTMAKNHQISLADMQKAFDEATSTGGRFAGAMQAQATTLSGAWQRLQNVLQVFFNAAANPFMKWLEWVVYDGTNLLVAALGKMGDIWNTVTDFLGKHHLALAAVAGAITALVVPALAFLATTIVGPVIAAFGAAVVAMAPFIAIGAVVAGVAYIIYKAWSDNFLGIPQVIKGVFDYVMDAMSTAINWMIDKLNSLIAMANSVLKTLHLPTIGNIGHVDVKAAATSAFNFVAGAVGGGIADLQKSFADFQGLGASALEGAGITPPGADGGGGSGKKTQAQKDEEKAAKKQAAEDAKLLTQNLADLTSEAKKALSSIESNASKEDALAKQINDEKSKIGSNPKIIAEAQTELAKLQNEDVVNAKTVTKNMAFLAKSTDERAVADLEALNQQKDANTQNDSMRAVNDELARNKADEAAIAREDKAAAAAAKHQAALDASARRKSARSATNTAASASVSPSIPSNDAVSGLPSGSVQAGAIVLLDTGSTAQKNYYFSIKNNNFYGSATDFAQQIGDSIIKELQKQLPTSAF